MRRFVRKVPIRISSFDAVVAYTYIYIARKTIEKEGERDDWRLNAASLLMRVDWTLQRKMNPSNAYTLKAKPSSILFGHCC